MPQVLRHAVALLFAQILLFFVCLPVAHASFDEFADEFRPEHFELKSAGGMSLAFKGEVKLGLHDIEGKGGPDHDSGTDTLTIGTRSPHVNLDSFALALRLGLDRHLGVNTLLSFTTNSADVSAMWLEFKASAPERLIHRIELGYQTPIVATDRKSERYALMATSAWRHPEFHLAYEGAWLISDDVRLEFGASVAMMRPLILAGVQETRAQGNGTINVLSYGSAKSFSGNGPVGGARALISIYGAFAEVFGFIGKLSAQSGTDVLRSGFPNYRFLQGYDPESASTGDFWWWGGRAGFRGQNIQAFAEAIVFREDLLDRFGVYGQISYDFDLPGLGDGWLQSLTPMVRGSTLRILGSTDVNDGIALRSPSMINAVSWDWNELDLAIALEIYRDFVWLKAEYYFIWEENGVPLLNVDTVPFKNNELLIQLALRF